MLRPPIATKLSRILVGILLVGFALVASADFRNQSSCTGECRGLCGSPSDGTRGQDDQGRCDQCVACIIAHGQLASVVPAATLLGPPLAAVSSVQFHHLVNFEPLPTEIFHPPLAATC
jgi:hypothetical protein